MSSQDANLIESIILESQKQYDTNPDQLKVPDEVFDQLVSIYEKKTGSEINTQRIKSKGKVKLPIPVSSLAKAKAVNKDKSIAVKELTKFKARNYGNHLIQDKLDGISIVVEYPQCRVLRTGDGIYGDDISFSFELLNLPKVEDECIIRGEVIISLDKFNLIQGYKNPRNYVASLFHRKDNHEPIRECTFYAYEIMSFYNKPFGTIEQQMNHLKNLGFTTPVELERVEIEYDALYSLLERRRKEVPYLIDGLVIKYSDYSYPIPETDENPDYAIAFKVDRYYVSVITGIEWNKTRFGKLFPTIKIEPINIDGTEVTYATGNNAAQILNRKLGVGAVVEVFRGGDTIPQVGEVFVPSDNIPWPTEEFKWDNNRVHIYLTGTDPSVQVRKIHYFLSTLGVENWGEKRVEVAMEADILVDIDDYFNEDKIRSLVGVNGIGPILVNGLLASLNEAFSKLTHEKLVVALGLFDQGIGLNRITPVLENFPYWQTSRLRVDEVKRIHGIGDILADNIVNGLDKYRQWLIKHPQFANIEKKVELIDQKLKGHVVAFTGFRSEEMEHKIVAHGGKISSSVTNATTILVVKDGSTGSEKAKKALTKGIIITTRDKFAQLLA